MLRKYSINGLADARRVYSYDLIIGRSLFSTSYCASLPTWSDRQCSPLDHGVRWMRRTWSSGAAAPGRPRIAAARRELIRRLADENAIRGEERIANEILLKLGLRISPHTVRKYMPKRFSGHPRGDQRWATFLRNHGEGIIACDLFVSVMATFRLLYVFVVIHHGSRRLVHINVTAHPTAA